MLKQKYQDMMDMANVQICCEDLRELLMKHNDLRDGFVASVESVLNEKPPEMNSHDLAVAIINRIVGIE